MISDRVAPECRSDTEFQRHTETNGMSPCTHAPPVRTHGDEARGSHTTSSVLGLHEVRQSLKARTSLSPPKLLRNAQQLVPAAQSLGTRQPMAEAPRGQGSAQVVAAVGATQHHELRVSHEVAPQVTRVPAASELASSRASSALASTHLRHWPPESSLVPETTVHAAIKHATSAPPTPSAANIERATSSRTRQTLVRSFWK